MSLWTITLLIGYFIVIALNLIFSFSITTALQMLLTLAIIMLPSALIFVIGRVLPKKMFNENGVIFRVGKFKQWVCKITNVKVWKDTIPVGGDTLDSMSKPKDEEFLNKYIFESCFADWLHSSLCIWSVIGAIIVLLIDRTLFLPMALPIAILFIYQNLTSTIIQWYVRPRMIRYRTALIKRNNRQNKENIENTEG